MLLYKNKKNSSPKANRLLISITVLGSAGPIRFVVNETELVADVIDMTLKSYAREGRFPILGSNIDHFVLYCPHAGSEALSPWDKIGDQGARNFMLCKKPQLENLEVTASEEVPKSSGSLRSWINKSLHLKISSH